MAELPARYADAHSFAFGDSPELADELLALVLAGTKTATCGALRDHEVDGEPLPEVGRRDVVLDGAGRPACVIETTEVEIVPFDAVTKEFAEAEGEGPYEAWREGHIAFFSRNGGWRGDMKLVCERFKLIEVLDRDPR
ncbi:ASCH domain-containing protein [Pelagibacterium sp. 26DY04]|uniref:ASCH domain-containing protein n=1 Tax=Pelagibacterium sp. 26DY04 TaxID=2967130 RepID=UPI002814C780|nr:ASCH domain-containing protein [Pelagibacterium sp. 26DY04]WMT87293.1 ASCH domain-containing protein [Pelagibacterium sp. 26DY04]